MTPYRGITGLFNEQVLLKTSDPRAVLTPFLRPDIVGVRGTFLYRASEFYPPLLRGSKCIPPLFSSPKGREWNKV